MLQGDSPLKSVFRSFSPAKNTLNRSTFSPSKNSPSKLAMRMNVMRKTIDTPQIKSPRLSAKKISFIDDVRSEDYQIFENMLKTRDLASIFKDYRYKDETIEKIIKTLEIFDLKNIKSPLDLEKFKEFIENDNPNSIDFLKYVFRNIVEKSRFPDIQKLVEFVQDYKIHLDDSTLETKLRKEKKGEELERLLKEFTKLNSLKRLISLKLY